MNNPIMYRDKAKSMAMRALIFSFSYGLIRLKKLTVSEEKFMLGLIAAPTAMLIATEMLSPNNFWPWIAVISYLIGGVFIFLSIFKSNDREEAMSSISIKNNWVIVLSVAVFGSLTFGGVFYSLNMIKHDIKKIISSAEAADQAIAYVDSGNFGFPTASEMEKYAPDSPLLKKYEQCAKNPQVLMRLVKNELAKEITVRDYSKEMTAWPFPLGYIIYNGDYPSGPYTYGFVFGKKFEDQHYKLKDLIVIIPIEESKRKDRVIQHLALIDSLCRDL